MSDKIVSVIRFFFKENFSQKRLFVCLMSILIMIVCFFMFHKHQWFVDIKTDYGNWGIIIFLSFCFLISFIIFEVICNSLSANMEKTKQYSKEFEMRIKREEETFDILCRLSDWQKSFLLQNVMRGKALVESYEIGDYEIVWGPQMEALVAKRIVSNFRYGVYEINPKYFDYIKKYYDPKEHVLKPPDFQSSMIL